MFLCLKLRKKEEVLLFNKSEPVWIKLIFRKEGKIKALLLRCRLKKVVFRSPAYEQLSTESNCSFELKL